MSDEQSEVSISEVDYVVSHADFVVSGGQVYKIMHNPYEGTMYFEDVEEIPEDYWERMAEIQERWPNRD